MILMLDNYDSFTYNLVQYIQEMTCDVYVARNDELDIPGITALMPSGIVLSPGPGGPKEAGVCLEVVRKFSGELPILGVCLGHQTIAEAFGARIVEAKTLMHGKTSLITADGDGVFKGIKEPFQAMRYHSLVVERDSLPDELIVSAESDDGEIMGVRHLWHPTEGIQFHPESIMTTVGKRLLRNFLKMCGEVY
jgi:anthranilate synthase/aminodeoxychorismate synthase-like glutamine amidotransferase